MKKFNGNYIYCVRHVNKNILKLNLKLIKFNALVMLGLCIVRLRQPGYITLMMKGGGLLLYAQNCGNFILSFCLCAISV